MRPALAGARHGRTCLAESSSLKAVSPSLIYDKLGLFPGGIHLNRFVVSAITAGTLFLRAAPAQQGQLDASPTLFTVMAAINAAGYDADLDSPNNNPLRKAVRYLAPVFKPILPRRLRTSALPSVQRLIKEELAVDDILISQDDLEEAPTVIVVCHK